MVRFHVLTQVSEPMLWVWRDQAADANAVLAYESLHKGRDADGFHLFEAQLDHQIHQPAHVQLHTQNWEQKDCAKDIPRTKEYRFPDDLWMSEGATRVVAENPFAGSGRDKVTVHLITAKKYREGQLYIWTPGHAGRFVQSSREDEYGPVYDVALNESERHLFLFKFVDKWNNYEPDYANRLWVAQDGGEIWAHSQAAAVSSARSRCLFMSSKPAFKLLRICTSGRRILISPQPSKKASRAQMAGHVSSMRYTPGASTVSCCATRHCRANGRVPRQDGISSWMRMASIAPLTATAPDASWARKVSGWTLEGDHELFGSQPNADREVFLEIVARGSGWTLGTPLFLDVWINRARTQLHTGLTADSDGRYRFQTYSEVITSFSFRSDNAAEQIERHFVKAVDDESALHRYVVLDRADILSVQPLAGLFSNPPFDIERPGVWVADDHVRFAVHCPKAASVEVVGDWTGWQASPLPMRSTLDGAYWWAQVPVADITAALGNPFMARSTSSGSIR